MIFVKFLHQAALVAVAMAVGALANAQAADPAVPITAITAQKIAAGVVSAVEQNYVFPDRASAIAQVIRGKMASGSYASIRTAQELTQQLETDLRSVNGDKHLIVSFSATPTNALPISAPADDATELERRFASYGNNGFVKAERLEGNIGYLDISGFLKPDTLREVTTAAFGFIADTSALIIDMRRNGGGWPAGVAWVSSYLFHDRVHLNDLRHREADRTEEFWTTPEVPGRKYADRPVYVLTSKSTFSGGEEFAYNLQALKRAVVVGETTRGGAHPVKPFRLDDHFQVWVPFARAVNPLTRGNWEGRGVQPDVEVPADKALATAYLAALRAARANEQDALISADQDRAIAAALSSASTANPQ
jgi:retinol-binding protein 3